MRLIVGIGNPGLKYINTRHNIGFHILDEFCQIHKLKFQPSKSDFWSVESSLSAFHFFLIKPATYVNNSGVVVKEVMDELDISPSDILVIYDDTNIDLGELRIRKSGSDGGHNGLKSIIYHLENDRFIRLRVGVGSPENDEELSDYVLSPFPEEELMVIDKNKTLIVNLIEKFISGGIGAMLNFYSRETNIKSSNIS